MEVLLLIPMLAFAWACRTVYYWQVFNEWHWGPLPDHLRERLIPGDSRVAYEKGLRDGQAKRDE